MPTSVLLAVLVAAGLLALAPTLVRRHDVTERQVAERAQSTARVLSRRQRRRSVPGSRPVNPSQVLVPTLRTAAPVAPVSPAGPPGSTGSTGDGSGATDSRPSRASASGRRGRALAVVPRSAPPARRARPDQPPAIYRRRRVLAALLLLNLVKLVGVMAAGPGFWIGFAVTCTLLLAYVAHLRNLALADQRQRRAEAARAADLAVHQAEIRREQERRAAARREGARRMAEQRESLRRAAANWSVSPTVSYRPAPKRRSRAS